MNLSHQLRAYLDGLGMSVTTLSKKSGVSRDAIHDWLINRKPRDISQVKKVADVLGITVDQLCFGSGIEKDKEADALAAIVGEGWLGGLFEVRFRRVKK